MNNFQLYLRDVSKTPIPTEEEQIALIKKAQGGDVAAKKKLMAGNARLVIKVAKSYSSSRISFEDLVAEGNLGLGIAVDKFDPSLNFKFSTYAVYWIKQSISKAIADKNRNVRLPAHIYQLLAKYKQVVNQFLIAGVKPTDEQIAEKLKIDIDKLMELRQWKHDAISLETPLGDEDGETIGDLQADMHTDTPAQYTEKKLLHDKLIGLIHEFKPRTQEIMKLRYGLGEDGDSEEYFKEHTLDEIGAILGITRERVRQIEKEALDGMRVKMRSGI